MLRSVLFLLVVAFLTATGTFDVVASNPVKISATARYKRLPFDPSTINKVIKVIVEHHKDNTWLEVGCEGAIYTVSKRLIAGIDKKGVFEEFFFFNLPDGTYECEVVLTRGEKSFHATTGEFIVM